MSFEEIRDRIQVLIEPVVSSAGFELYDVEFGKMKGKALLRVFIEKEGGVTIDDCEHVSREVEAVLDVEDPIPSSYVLEVSSPGMDRPLKKTDDFKRFKGSKIRAVTFDPVDKQTFFIGELTEADDEKIIILLPKGREVVIPYKNISKARLEVDI